MSIQSRSPISSKGRSSLVNKIFTCNFDIKLLTDSEFISKDTRMLRVAVGSILEILLLAAETIHEFGHDDGSLLA